MSTEFCRPPSGNRVKILKRFHDYRYNVLFLGLISLIWLIYKTGRKPSRILYPCQQAAAANVGIFLLPPLGMVLHRLSWKLKKYLSPRQWVGVEAIGLLMILVVFGGVKAYQTHQENQTQAYFQTLTGPEGKRLGPLGSIALGTIGVAFASIPHAMALPSPHRVVAMHDSDATKWTFPCTGAGVCSEYYGNDSFVDQAVVDTMVDRGIQELTGENTSTAAWQVILPDYEAGEKIAVKVNFNDSIMGGGSSGYGDNDAYVDALPQIINSLVKGLTAFGVAQEDIWIYDASRYITDRFRVRIRDHFPDIRYFDRTGNGDDVTKTGFTVSDTTAEIDFSGSDYTGSHRITDCLVTADYLINIPIMKFHGGAGITLSLKNHLGTVDGFVSGGHSMHNKFYLDSIQADTPSNPIVNINGNPHIRDKTVLIVGDGLYGTLGSNNSPPQRWQTFDSASPNLLFFAVDPVAADSVMYDWLNRERTVRSKSKQILNVAATAGLGVHEHWDDDQTRRYTAIDYQEVDLDNAGPPGPPAAPKSVMIRDVN